MAFMAFLFEAVLISLSGVMAPGPVTTVVVGKGSESPHAGALVAVGHGIVEIPLMIAVFYGIGYLLDLPYVKAVIALVGGAFLLMMGIGMFRSIKQGVVGGSGNGRSPVIAGVMLSIGNPYFLVWWGTVGAVLIMRSAQYGVMGFLVFAVAHWLCDFLWDYFLSALSFKGGQFFGRRFQQVVFAVCGVFLLFFSGKLVIDVVRGLVV